MDDITGKNMVDASRYHLFASPLCPFSHACIAVRAAAGLCETLSCSVAEKKDRTGWVFAPVDFAPFSETPGGVQLQKVYSAARSDGQRHTSSGEGQHQELPLLWDKGERRIVSTDPMAILRIVHGLRTGTPEESKGVSTPEPSVSPHSLPAQSHASGPALDLCPSDLRSEVDAMNKRVQREITDGVNRVAFARDADARSRARASLFDALVAFDDLLGRQRYLVGGGDRLTESDWLLFTTLVRFDIAYRGAFGCSEAKLSSAFPHLHHFLRELYQVPDVAPTCAFRVYLTYYFVLPWSLRKLMHLPGSLLTAFTAKTELNLPHLREERNYSNPGLHGVLTKLSMLMHIIAIMAAAMYLLDEELFNSTLNTVLNAFSVGHMQIPDEWQ